MRMERIILTYLIGRAEENREKERKKGIIELTYIPVGERGKAKIEHCTITFLWGTTVYSSWIRCNKFLHQTDALFGSFLLVIVSLRRQGLVGALSNTDAGRVRIEEVNRFLCFAKVNFGFTYSGWNLECLIDLHVDWETFLMKLNFEFRANHRRLSMEYQSGFGSTKDHQNSMETLIWSYLLWLWHKDRNWLRAWISDQIRGLYSILNIPPNVFRISLSVFHIVPFL